MRMMVCAKCEKKLAKIATPDPFRVKASKSSGASASSSSTGPSRRVNENKALTGKKTRFQPYRQFNRCRICKQNVHQPQANYCQGCAYQKGICAMCGKQLLDVKNYKQTSV
ncbi:cysteine-rich PDZ-binding protein-like isoform X2 [Corticium candelabrum]|uniref:cysteine-rich PDZ-binding protein-like isoform X2 n=1 Tax=Corticium candelabrum TaxID=121492 RepID=UPI002E2770CB|nr:cysteine-rich PDZ-binding protein-like isoform X2 [Corticium candelabrum]